MGARHILTAFLLCVGICLTSAARADFVAPSAYTPLTVKPEDLRRPTGSEPILQQKSAPAVSSQLEVLIGSVEIKGAFPELDLSNNVSAQGLVGRRMTVDQIYAFAKGLEAIYAREGYVFVRVTVPPQNLLDRGRLEFIVIDGYVESLDLTDLPNDVRDAVARHVLPLVGRRHLKRDEIERHLLLAGDIPGLTLKSTLARGDKEGGVKLVLSGKFRPVSGSLSTDNRNPSSLGTWQLRGALAVNNVLGGGEQVYVSTGSAADLQKAFTTSSLLALYGGGLIVPIGADGLTINPEFTNSRTATPAINGTPATIGTFNRLAIRLRQAQIRSQKENLYLGVTAEFVEQEITAPDFNTTISLDRYVVARAGPEYDVVLPNGGTLRAGFSFSQGLAGRSAAEASASNIPMSQSGASSEFTKTNVSGRYSHPLPSGFRIDLIAAGQESFGKPLFRSEQFALDGNEAVSAFAAGTFNADAGYILRPELSRPFDVTLHTASGPRPAHISPYVFGATGYGWLYSATSVEQSAFSASALGAGVRAGVDPIGTLPGINIGFELARQYTNVSTQPQAWRANFFATVAF